MVLSLIRLLWLVSSSWAWTSVPSRKVSPSNQRNNCFFAQSASRQGPVGTDSASSISRLESILQEHGYNHRTRTIYQDDLPLLAEVYIDGHSILGMITSFESAENNQEPKCVVDFDVDNSKVVDFGQITTIWEVFDRHWNKALDSASKMPSEVVDQALDRLFRSRVGKARSSSRGLTKKQVPKLLVSVDANQKENAENILRKVLKAGSGLSRLVDSATASEYIFRGKQRYGVESYQRAVAAYLLSEDAKTGGRFKRWPCVHISSEYDVDNILRSIKVINGGWLVVDQSVRAGTEARKFVQRTQEESRPNPLTVADERIIQRLECLAMGELFSQEVSDVRDLELDVREALNAMDLPLTPEGAKKALVQIGHWTGTENLKSIQPWSKPVLEAAAWYVSMDKERPLLEDRVDLTELPCVSVDAKRTAFRDDAIGVRPRAGTGRKVDPGASKWEILVHIADVSDIYSLETMTQDDSDILATLRRAAQNRGTSRYDLPFGPLHLLPPVVLNALSLAGRRDFHRAVTLWTYIDERSGKLLDAGIERSMISSPINLSFAEASSIMDGSMVVDPNTRQAKTKAILLVVERNLKLWDRKRQGEDEVARKREARLTAREMEARQAQSWHGDDDDSGRKRFRRTRGHRLVDSALDIYAYTVYRLIKRAKAPVPIVPGAGPSRGGRVATAPLRRYIDGQSQRQALAVLCDYGRPMSLADCKEAGKVANEARNSILNVRATRNAI